MLRHADFTGGKTAHIPKVLWEELDIAMSIDELKKNFSSYPMTKEAYEEK